MENDDVEDQLYTSVVYMLHDDEVGLGTLQLK